MSVLYIISVIALLVSFLLVKKSDKVLDVVTWIAISIVILLCFNTFVCYLFTLICIPINLLSLSVVNILLTSVFTFFIVKSEKQKYEFNKNDLIIIGIIIALTILIVVKNFGIPLQINYLSTDSGVHYNATHNFYKSDSLLIKEGNEMMAGAYSNAGIWLKTMAPLLHDIDLYNVYICFDIFMYMMTGLLMYIAVKGISPKSVHIFPISLFITIVYMIGYPLNVLLFGYFYLQLSIIVVSTIIIIMCYFKEKIISSKYMILMLFLLCFELFFSYYLFVPAVYGALGIYYIYFFNKETGKLFNKEMGIYIAITLCIPFIIGFIYHILPGLNSVNDITAVKTMSMEGYIYRNYITNILLFIPFIIYYLLKQKETNFLPLQMLVLIVFMCILYIGHSFEMVSTYYFYKTYFILWFMILCLFGYSAMNIIEEREKDKIVVYAFIFSYLFLMMLAINVQNVQANKEYVTHETVADVMNIYATNKGILTDPNKVFISDEIEVLKYLKDEIEIGEDTDLIFLVRPRQEFWIWGMFDYKNRKNLENIVKYEEVEKCNNKEKYDYIVYFNRTKEYNFYKKYIDLNRTVLYNNVSGGVLKNE